MSSVKPVPGYACLKCNWSDVFKPVSCPRCRSPVRDVTFSGLGKIATYTVIRYPPEGFERESPYVVGLIDLENGPRVMARIAANDDEVEIGGSTYYAGNSKGRLEFALRPL